MSMFLSMADPNFWGRMPEEVGAIDRAGGNEGLKMSYFTLGKIADNPMFVTPLRMEPGYILPRHAYDCHRMELIVQGSMDVGERVLGPGDVMITEPGVLYGPHIAGPEGCTAFDICSEFEGGHRLLLQDEAGELVTFNMLQPELAATITEKTNKLREDVRRS